MLFKDIVLALAIISLAAASAPSWVDSGVNLTYTQGSTTTTYHVTSRTSTDITYKKASSGSSSTPTLSENATADYGDFWFDTTLVYGASAGESVGDYTISDESTQTYAGKSWDTESVQFSLGGATVTMVIDKATGLILKISVNAPGQTVQDITLTSEYIPAFDTPAASPPPASPPPQQNSTIPSVPQTNTSSAQVPTSPAQQNQTQPSLPPAQPYQPSSGSSSGGSQPIGGVQPYSTKSPFCCSSAFILALLAMVAVLKKG